MNVLPFGKRGGKRERAARCAAAIGVEDDEFGACPYLGSVGSYGRREEC
jgi:hypothetical protein